MIPAILITVVLIVVSYVTFLVLLLTNGRKSNDEPTENIEHVTRHGAAQDSGDFDYHT